MASRRAREQAERALKTFTIPGPQPPTPLEAQRQAVEQFAAKHLAPAVLPMAGALGGAGLGGAIGATAQVARPVLGTFLGESAGGMAGEALNQAAGLTEPSAGQIGLSGIAAPAGRASQVVRPPEKGLGVVPMTNIFGQPSRRASRTLNVLGARELEETLGRMVPAKAAREFFREASAAGVTVPLPKTAEALDTVIGQLSTASTRPTALRPLQNLKNKIQQRQFELPPDQLQQELELLGDMIGTAQKKGGTGFGAVKHVRAAIERDLENAVEVGRAGGMRGDFRAIEALQLGRQASLRQQTLNELETLAANAFKPLRGQGEAQQFNAAEVIRGIRKNRFFTKAFSEKEQQEIIKLLGKINKIPPLPPPTGQTFGFGQVGTVGAAAGTIGIGASMFGLPAQEAAGVGLAAGLGLPIGFNSVRVISQTLNFKEGRKLLGNLLSANKGDLTTEGMALLAGFLRAQTTEPGPMGEQLSQFFRTGSTQ